MTPNHLCSDLLVSTVAHLRFCWSKRACCHHRGLQSRSRTRPRLRNRVRGPHPTMCRPLARLSRQPPPSLPSLIALQSLRSASTSLSKGKFVSKAKLMQDSRKSPRPFASCCKLRRRELGILPVRRLPAPKHARQEGSLWWCLPVRSAWPFRVAMDFPCLCVLGFLLVDFAGFACVLHLVSALSFWLLARQSAQVLGCAMCFCRIAGVTIKAFRVFNVLLSLRRLCLLAVTVPWTFDFELPALISACWTFVLTRCSLSFRAWSLPVRGLQFLVQSFRVRAGLAPAFVCIFTLCSHHHSAPKCRKQFAGWPTAWVRVVPTTGFPNEFDSLLGFPGESPNNPNNLPRDTCWSLSTANVGSLKTSSFWQSDEDVVYCLQETRIGRNNFRTSRLQVEATKRYARTVDMLPCTGARRSSRLTPSPVLSTPRKSTQFCTRKSSKLSVSTLAGFKFHQKSDR